MIQVFPNPFQHSLVVQSQWGEIEEIEIFDAMGREVMFLRNKDRETIGQGAIKINTKDLPSGVYFVKVVSETNTGVKKVIKIK